MSEQPDPWDQALPAETSTEEWQQAVLAQLSEPFDRGLHYEKRGSGNRMFIYVPGYAYVERLNVLVGEWDQEVHTLDKITLFGKDMLIARVSVTIPGLGKRQHVGVQELVENMGADAMIKGAITDGMKKAMSLFGVGLYLSHKEETDLSHPRPVADGGTQPNQGAPTSYGASGDKAASVATKKAFQNVCREAGITEVMADAIALREFTKERWSFLTERQVGTLIQKITKGELRAESQ